MARIAVVYYSATGNVHRLAHGLAEGAEGEGVEVRIRQVEDEPAANLEDLEWADGVAFGTPTRFGNVAAQLKQFMDQAGRLWQEGKLATRWRPRSGGCRLRP